MSSASGTSYRLRVEVATAPTVHHVPDARMTGLYGRPPRGRPLWLGAVYLMLAVSMLACVRGGWL